MYIEDYPDEFEPVIELYNWPRVDPNWKDEIGSPKFAIALHLNKDGEFVDTVCEINYLHPNHLTSIPVGLNAAMEDKRGLCVDYIAYDGIEGHLTFSRVPGNESPMCVSFIERGLTEDDDGLEITRAIVRMNLIECEQLIYAVDQIQTVKQIQIKNSGARMVK